eukprot:5936222-Alexandrium_andersonii.AAC.1
MTWLFCGRRTAHWPKHSQHPPRHPQAHTVAERAVAWLRGLADDGDVELSAAGLRAPSWWQIAARAGDA